MNSGELKCDNQSAQSVSQSKFRSMPWAWLLLPRARESSCCMNADGPREGVDEANAGNSPSREQVLPSSALYIRDVLVRFFLHF